MKTSTLLLFATLIGLAGCSASIEQPEESCELRRAEICSRAAEAQLADGTLTVSYSSRPTDARVVPFVVPVFRTDGVLATEVDCYVNTDSHSYSLVRSDLAIPASSQQSIDFLRGRHLCADDGSYAERHPALVGTLAAVRSEASGTQLADLQKMSR